MDSSTKRAVNYIYYEELPGSERQNRGEIRHLLYMGVFLMAFATFVFVTYLIIYRDLYCRDCYTVLRAQGETLPPRVRIKYGEIEGVILTSRQGRSYAAYLGVPYANSGRFELPKSPDNWEGIFNATEIREQCIQFNKKSADHAATGREDCQHLNLYVPENAPKNLPTLVYIHGGGWENGNATRYGAEYFMDQDCILITFEWRLGPFGFLNSEDGIFKANLGFKDQVFLFKWVQENIRAFGGDPEKVLIFGNSGGAMAVHYNILSPMNKGLFKRAISQSGVASNALIAPIETPSETIYNLANAMNCTKNETTSDILDCLRGIDAGTLASTIDPSKLKYGPSVEASENLLDGDDAFLTALPLNLQLENASNEVEWILGVNNGEGITYSYNLWPYLESLDQYWDDIAPIFLFLNGTATDPNNIANDVKDFYFEGGPITNGSKYNLTDIFADRIQNHPTKVAGVLQANLAKVYLYYLTKRPEKSYTDEYKLNVTENVASHADELCYIFPFESFPYIPPESEYFEFSEMLCRYWVSFASTGIPAENWKPIEPGAEDAGMHWFQLDSEPKMISPFTERLKFWDAYPLDELYYMD